MSKLLIKSAVGRSSCRLVESKLLNHWSRDYTTGEVNRSCCGIGSTVEKKGADLRDHAFDVKVGEDDLDSFANLSVEEVVTLGVTRVEAWVVGTPESAVGRHRAVEPEGARHGRDLLAGCDPEI